MNTKSQSHAGSGLSAAIDCNRLYDLLLARAYTGFRPRPLSPLSKNAEATYALDLVAHYDRNGVVIDIR